MKTTIRFATLCVAFLALVACDALGGSKPTVIISSPASGSQYQAGQDVAVQSTSSDPQGIAHVDLIVDGSSPVKSDASPTGSPQAQFTVIQVWKAAGAGQHTLIVRATDGNGTTGEAAVTITVIGEIASASPTATATLSLPPIATAPASATPTSAASSTPSLTPAPSACTPNVQFIADVTIPDGTTVAAGSSFVKTWRVRNSGTCTWDSAYTIVFAGGEQFGAPSPSLIPQAAPGATVDISLSMIAPGAGGSHTSIWRLRASNGALFGTSLTTVINVPGAPPPGATATNTPTATYTPTSTRTATPTGTTPAASSTQILNQVSIPGGSTGNASAACPAGTRVTGGGFASNSNLFVYNSTMNGNGWQAYARNLSGASQLLNAYAICVSGISGTTTQVLNQVSVANGGIGHAVATCPAGQVVTGGGFAANDGEEIYNESPQGNGWEGYAKNTSGVSRLLNAYAICYNGVGATSTQVFAQATVPAGSTGSATISCPAGRIVTGGGYASQLGSIVYTTFKQGNGWQSFSRNTTGSNSLVNAYAICVDF